MYTSFIGKKFLATWNSREGKSYTAQQFFDEIMFKDFFDDKLHLLQVSNSKFVNPSVKGTNLEKYEMLREQISKAVGEKRADASFYVGYAAAKPTEGTSGQVTSMSVQIDEEEIYASWVGAALAIGVDGGYCLLIDKEDLLWKIFEGWKAYRKFLNETPGMKGRQIETWNGQWIHHIFNGGNPKSCVPETEKKEDDKKGSVESIKTLEWTRVIFSLCKKYPNEVLTVYGYNLSKVNLTLGFLNVYLPEVNKLFEFRNKVFLNKEDTILQYHEIETLLVARFNLKRAAEFGKIGIRSLEPQKLQEYFPLRNTPKAKEFNLSKTESHKLFLIFKLWIYAMLNRQELIDLADNLAKVLVDFENSGGSRAKTGDKRLSEQVRNSTTLKMFVDNMESLLSEFFNNQSLTAETVEIIRSAVREVHLKVSTDQFPLFLALVRFEHTSLKYQGSFN